MTHDEMIAVIQAHKEGKQIEFSNPSSDNWHLIICPSWNFAAHKYRIVEPKWRDATISDLNDAPIDCVFYLRDGKPQLGGSLVGWRHCSPHWLVMDSEGTPKVACRCEVKEKKL